MLRGAEVEELIGPDTVNTMPMQTLLACAERLEVRVHRVSQGSGVFLLPASLAPFGGISIIGWLASAGGATGIGNAIAREVAKLGGRDW